MVHSFQKMRHGVFTPSCDVSEKLPGQLFNGGGTLHRLRAPLVLRSFELKTRGISETVSVASGEVAEWFKAHAWKACVGNTTGGSNPPLSASLQRPDRIKDFYRAFVRMFRVRLPA